MLHTQKYELIYQILPAKVSNLGECHLCNFALILPIPIGGLKPPQKDGDKRAKKVLT
jgi:hypothetical protein